MSVFSLPGDASSLLLQTTDRVLDVEKDTYLSIFKDPKKIVQALGALKNSLFLILGYFKMNQQIETLNLSPSNLGTGFLCMSVSNGSGELELSYLHSKHVCDQDKNLRHNLKKRLNRYRKVGGEVRVG